MQTVHSTEGRCSKTGHSTHFHTIYTSIFSIIRSSRPSQGLISPPSASQGPFWRVKFTVGSSPLSKALGRVTNAMPPQLERKNWHVEILAILAMSKSSWLKNWLAAPEVPSPTWRQTLSKMNLSFQTKHRPLWKLMAGTGWNLKFYHWKIKCLWISGFSSSGLQIFFPWQMPESWLAVTGVMVLQQSILAVRTFTRQKWSFQK